MMNNVNANIYIYIISFNLVNFREKKQTLCDGTFLNEGVTLVYKHGKTNVRFFTFIFA